MDKENTKPAEKASTNPAEKTTSKTDKKRWKKTDQSQKYFKLGRPTKYKKEYCKAIVDYFTQDLYTQRVKSRVTTKSGNVTEHLELLGNPPKWFSDFAWSIGVATSTLHDWCKLFPEFNLAYMRAKELQHNHIKALANMNIYNSNFAQFTMVNISDWRIKNNMELSGKVESQVFFANMLEQADQALANERKVLASRN